jgi:pilus assembly protein Flp/PilA
MRASLLVLRRLLAQQKAATSVEYCLIISMIVLAMLVGFQAVGSQTNQIWGNVSSKVLTAR